MTLAEAPAERRPELVVGVDFGTLSGRAVVVRVSDGAELGSAVHPYSHAVMDRALTAGPAALAGAPIELPSEWALQDPQDYLDVLRIAVPAALEAARAAHGVEAQDVIGVGTDFTACTMVPTTADGTPLCSVDRFAARPPAYVQLWQLCGRYLRNACTAGYKGIYQDGKYPSRDFLAALNPDFAGFVAEKVEHEIGQLGQPAGMLTAQAASWTGLPRASRSPSATSTRTSRPPPPTRSNPVRWSRSWAPRP